MQPPQTIQLTKKIIPAQLQPDNRSHQLSEDTPLISPDPPALRMAGMLITYVITWSLLALPLLLTKVVRGIRRKKKEVVTG